MKKLLLTLGLAISITAFSGCGSSTDSNQNTTKATEQATKKLDESSIQSLCKELIEQKVFSDDLSETSSKIAASQLKLSDSDFSSIVCYKSSGATAEEITIVEAKDEIDLTSFFDSYLSEQKSNFESYLPAEVPKIESAIRKQSKNYFILIVANDKEKAEKILSKYI